MSDRLTPKALPSFPSIYLSHVRRPEDGRDDEEVADHGAEDDEGVAHREPVEGRVAHGLVVQDVLRDGSIYEH